MLNPRPTREPTAYDDDWEDSPPASTWLKWIVGVLVPLAMIAFGISAVVTQHATIGRRGAVALTGTNATAIGVAWIGLALFLHCHYFWGNLLDNHWLAEVGKIVGMAAAVGGLIVVLVRNGVLGIR